MKILSIKTEKMSLGRFGEAAAARYLRKNGYKILERNYVAASHEVDIIARDREHIIFAEVKTRTVGKENPNEPRPASAVSAEKQRSIITAARCYSRFMSGIKQRLDIIEVYVEEQGKKRRVKEIKHLEGAFNVNTAYGK